LGTAELRFKGETVVGDTGFERVTSSMKVKLISLVAVGAFLLATTPFATTALAVSKHDCTKGTHWSPQAGGCVDNGGKH
jgi:hypothetical protein